MDDLRIYCQNEEDQLNVVSYLQENFPNVKICTWDPDPEDTGSWGIFVDEHRENLQNMICEYFLCIQSFTACRRSGIYNPRISGNIRDIPGRPRISEDIPGYPAPNSY